MSFTQAVVQLVTQHEAPTSSVGLVNTYYKSQIYLAVAASVAGLVAVWQALEANRSRRTSAYMQLSRDYLTGEIETSRAALSALVGRLLTNKVKLEALPHELNQELQRYRRDEPAKYQPHARLIFFFENVGVLVGQKYVKMEDVALMLGGAYTTSFDFYATHIRERRAEATPPDPLLFEHFEKTAVQMRRFIEKRKRQTQQVKSGSAAN